MRAFVALLLLACAPPPTCWDGDKPDQCLAEAIVWGGLGHGALRPPVTVWHDPAPCPYDRSIDALPLEGRCVEGFTRSGDWEVHAIWRGSFSASAFTHELMHIHLRLAYGDGDPGHVREEWQTLVPHYNARLVEAGL